MNRGDLLACPQCDLLQRDAVPPPRKALCSRCGATLYHRHEQGLDRTLALTLGALLLFALANAFPILSLELQGERTEATLAGAVLGLWAETPLVAALVFVTAIAMPLAELVALAWLIVPARLGAPCLRMGPVFRLAQVARRWGMIDVVVLAVVVSFAKLRHVADVTPGLALWALIALMVSLSAIEASYDPRELWRCGRPV